MDDLDLFPDLEPDQQPPEGLWDAKHHYRRDGPETSKAAAYQAEPVATAHEGMIVAAIKRYPDLGLTINEVVDELSRVGTPLGYHQVSRRFSNLQRHNWIYDTGVRRKTPSQRDAIVWKTSVGNS